MSKTKIVKRDNIQTKDKEIKDKSMKNKEVNTRETQMWSFYKG